MSVTLSSAGPQLSPNVGLPPVRMGAIGHIICNTDCQIFKYCGKRARIRLVSRGRTTRARGHLQCRRAW